MIDIYFDGGTDGLQTCVVIDIPQPKTFEARFETKLTNNELEYKALLHAMTVTSLHLLPQPITFIGDSEVIIKQMKEEYMVKAQNLVPLYRDARQAHNALVVKGFTVTYRWIPRHANKAGIHIEHNQKKSHKKLTDSTMPIEEKIKQRLHRLLKEWSSVDSNETFTKLLGVELLALLYPIEQSEVEMIYQNLGVNGLIKVMEARGLM